MKNFLRIILVLIILLVCVVVIPKLLQKTSENTVSNNKDVENTSSSNKTTVIANNEIDENKYSYSTETLISLSDGATTVNGSDVKTDGDVIYITNAGAYRITGSLTNGRIIVDAKGKDVKLILDNCNITCNYGSPIYVYKSSSTMIYLNDGTVSTLTDGEEYTFDDSYSSKDDEEPNACLYSKSDLIIAGSGTLNIDANYSNALTSKDTLIIEDATINVDAKNHAINGKDSNTIRNATINIVAGEDGIRSTNEDDETTVGWIVIENSDITLEVGDDGIHAESLALIDGGKINIVKSHEGIEGKNVTINSGEITINADDDGINVNGGANNAGMFRTPGTEVKETGYKLLINGGTITVNSVGDGLDSNGSIEMNGGYVVVNGPTNSANGAIDYDGSFVQTGGTLIAVGASGMAEAPSKVENQGLIYSNVSNQSANTKITIKDENENVVLEFTALKAFSNIVVCTPDIKSDSEYKIYLNDNMETTVTATTQSSRMGGGFGIPGGRDFMNNGENGEFPERKRREDFQNGEMPEPPEGMELPESFELFNEMERPELPEGAEFPKDFDPTQRGNRLEMPERVQKQDKRK